MFSPIIAVVALVVAAVALFRNRKPGPVGPPGVAGPPGKDDGYELHRRVGTLEAGQKSLHQSLGRIDMQTHERLEEINAELKDLDAKHRKTKKRRKKRS